MLSIEWILIIKTEEKNLQSSASNWVSDSIVAVLKNFLMKKILKRILKIQQHEIKTYQTHINASWCGNSSMEKMVHHQQPIPRTNPNNRYGRREREKKRIKIHVTKSKMNFYCTFLLIFSFFYGKSFSG